MLRPFLLLLVVLLAACGAPEAPAAGAATGQPAYGKLIRIRGGSYRLISPDELDEMRQAGDPLLVNVHIPYEGEIEGTDAFIPFSEIEQHLGELPPNKDAAIVLYCRRGAMSGDAARVLARLGYSGIYELKGGMELWKATGRPVVVVPR